MLYTPILMSCFPVENAPAFSSMYMYNFSDDSCVEYDVGWCGLVVVVVGCDGV